MYIVFIQGTKKKLRTKASMRSYAPASLAGEMGETRSELGDSYPVSLAEVCKTLQSLFGSQFGLS